NHGETENEICMSGMRNGITEVAWEMSGLQCVEYVRGRNGNRSEDGGRVGRAVVSEGAAPSDYRDRQLARGADRCWQRRAEPGAWRRSRSGIAHPGRRRSRHREVDAAAADI